MSSGVLIPVLGGALVVVLLALVAQTWRLKRRDVELEATGGAMARQESLVSLGRLMAGIAHELNTPLGAVCCSVGTQQQALGKLEAAVAELEGGADPATVAPAFAKVVAALKGTNPVLDEALARTNALLREMRLAGRGELPDPEPVDVNAVLEGTLLLLQHELKNSVTVRREFGELPPVAGWPGPLGQVFLNLVLNARQAVGDGGEITIRTDTVDGRVRVRVTDNGPGLPQVCLDRLFEAGFTTKDADAGTGLGLFISRKIITRHRGELKAENPAGGGAEFTVLLPVADA